MPNTCAGVTGPQVAVREFVGGSTLGWGPVGPADWSAKPMIDGSEPPTQWPGPIAVAGWEFFSEPGLRRCFESVSQKYPPGWAFAGASDVSTVLGSDVLARAEAAYDVNRLAVALLDEWVCQTARTTLPDWWADYGLPDACGIDNLCAKVAAVGGATCQYFVDLGAMLGFDITCADIAPEIQAGGNWQLGVDQMPPDPVYDGGGSELGFAYVGPCPDGDPEPATTVVECVEWAPPSVGPLLCGCAAPWALDYTGTAYHTLVGLPQPVSLIPSFAVVGSWSLGCVPLCSPPRDELLCFLARYRPAHVVAVPIAIPSDTGGDVDGGRADTDFWMGLINDGGA